MRNAWKCCDVCGRETICVANLERSLLFVVYVCRPCYATLRYAEVWMDRWKSKRSAENNAM